MNHCTKEQLIAFETRIKELWEAGELPFLLHLSGGNEEQLIGIFAEIQPGDWVFSSHRNHYHYLLCGGSAEVLEAKIRRGDSMFVFGRAGAAAEADRQVSPTDVGLECHFLSSSILAGTCGMAGGVAWDIKGQEAESQSARDPHVWCFLGDGAEDEGHFYEAVRFVQGHGLPCTFVIEDNDRQVETSVRGRYGRAPLGLEDMALCVRRYTYTPTYPHAGSGCKHNITFKPEVVQAYLQAERQRRPGAGFPACGLSSSVSELDTTLESVANPSTGMSALPLNTSGP